MKKILLYAQVPNDDLHKVLYPLFQAAKREFRYETTSLASMKKFFSEMVAGETQVQGMYEIHEDNFAAIYYFREDKDVLLPIPGLNLAPMDMSTPFDTWRGIPLYVLPPVHVFVKYFQKKNVGKKGKAQRKKYIKAAFDLIQKVRGTSIYPMETKTRWCHTVGDVQDLVHKIKDAGLCAIDTETFPDSPGVPADKWLKHNTSYWLARTRILLFSPYVGYGWVVPSFDPLSWFNLGMEDEIEVVLKTKDQPPGKYLTDELWDLCNSEGLIYDDDDIGMIEPDSEFWIYKNREVISDYLEVPITAHVAQAEAFLLNSSYAKAEKVENIFFDVVTPLLKDDVVENVDIHKVFQNYSFDRNIFKYPRAGLGWEVKGPVDDTLLMMHAEDKVMSNALKPNAEKYWPEFLGWGDDIDYVIGSLQDLGDYGAVDLDATLRVYQLNFLKLLRKPRVYYFYRNALLGSMEWFADLEYEGDIVDLDRLAEGKKEIQAELANLTYQMSNNPRFKQYVLNRNRDLQKENMEILEAILKNKLRATEEKIIAKLQALEIEEKTHLKSYQTWKAKLDWLRSEDHDPESPFAYKFVTTIREKQALVAAGDVEKYRIWDKGGRANMVNNVGTKTVHSATVFNFDSGDQLTHFIYESKHGLRFPKKQMLRKRKDPVTGRHKTVKELVGPVTTDDLYWIEPEDKSGFIKALMIYKVIRYYLTKIEEIEEVMDPYGGIHSNYRFVSTDRTASSNPNMQNVPQRTFVEEARPYLEMLLRSFVSPDGWIRGKCDLAQAEIRVFAELYKIDKIAKLISEDEDLHTTAARTCMNISDEEWNALPKSEQKFKRTFGKILNFGLLYGASVTSLIDYAKNQFKIIIEKKHGEEMRRIFFEVLYSEIPEAHKRQIQKIHRLGYCETLFGSRKDLPDLKSPDRYFMAAAQRQGINMPVQGTAGIYMYWVAAIFNLRRIVKGYKGRLMNIIHDDLPSFVPPEELEPFARDLMAAAADPVTKPYFGFSFDRVPMDSDYEYGTDWTNQKNTVEK